MSSQKKINAQITISRPQRSDGVKMVTIEVHDPQACVNFLEVRLSLEAFAEALTGLSYVHCDALPRGLDKVGTRRVMEALVFEMPEGHVTRDKELAKELAKKHAKDGWIADTYFNSQSSFFSKDGKNFARTSQYKYVPTEYIEDYENQRNY